MRLSASCALTIWLSACNAVFGMDEATTLGESAGGGGQGGSAAIAGAAGDAATAGACTKNAECLDGDASNPRACVDGRCVNLLLQPECPYALPEAGALWLSNLRSSEPDPLIFGIFTLVPTRLYGIQARNFDLALTELARVAEGIPTADGRRRRVLAVVCRNLDLTPEQRDRAIDHLIDDLRVPGIITELDAADIQYAFERGGAQNHVFFMNPGVADQTLIDIVDDGLLWHLLPPGETLGSTYAPLLDRTLRHLRRQALLSDDEAARVALVTAEDVRALSAVSRGIVASATLNGRALADNAPGHFRSLSISSAVLSPQARDYTDAIEALIAFRPHVVIAAATSEFLTAFVPALESELADAPPFYLLSPWQAADASLGLLQRRMPLIFSRVAGVNYATAEDQTLYRRYLERLDAEYPALAGTEGYENFYDAAYFLIHAAAAAPRRERLTGADMVQGMRRLFAGGDAFDIGPHDLNSIFGALETPGRSITLNATVGPPNFDPRTGVRDSPGSVWCLDERGRVHFDVLRMAPDGSLVGNFDCFELDEP